MMRKVERESEGTLHAGQDLVVAGYVGLAGTQILLKACKEQLRQWFSAEYLAMAASGEGFTESFAAADGIASAGVASDEKGKVPCGLEFWSAWGATECEAVGEGGILTAIWNLSGAYETGLEFSLRRIPIRQETIEVCERLELNPYRLYSEHCYLLTADNGSQLVDALAEKGIFARVIGKINAGVAREMIVDGGRGFLERPQKDELYKIVPKERWSIEK